MNCPNLYAIHVSLLSDTFGIRFVTVHRVGLNDFSYWQETWWFRSTSKFWHELDALVQSMTKTSCYKAPPVWWDHFQNGS